MVLMYNDDIGSSADKAEQTCLYLLSPYIPGCHISWMRDWHTDEEQYLIIKLTRTEAVKQQQNTCLITHICSSTPIG